MIDTGQAGADTRAGTVVTNVATMQVHGADGETTVASNPVAIVVAERLDVTLARADGAIAGTPGDGAVAVTPGGVAVPVLLANRGNGREAFAIAAVPADASVRVRLIAIDRDGDGRYDPAVDAVLVEGETPALDADEMLRLLVLLDPVAAPVTAGTLDVTALAVTGSGPAGTAFAARGDGGGDAVSGRTAAQASLSVPLETDGSAAPVLIKSQSVRAPDGSAAPVPGAIVTYRLEARFPASAAAARIVDPIPAGTAYVAGSLRLDAAPLSDAVDGDAGRADAAGIAVELGDVAPAASRIVQFQVTIR